MLSAAEFLQRFDRAGALVNVTWTPAGGGTPVTFKASFQDAGSAVRFGMVSADEPEILFEASHCPNLTNGDTVTINGTDYRVRDGGNFKDATARRFRVRAEA
jgi:hypothetical protein